MNTELDFESLGQGTHLCGIFRNTGEQLDMVVPYMLAGLKKGEQCVSVVNKEIAEEATRALYNLGIDVKKCQAWGQFLFLDPADTYLNEGYFDPERMINSVVEAEKRALLKGFTGLRSTGEVAWTCSKLPGTERLIEYEVNLNRFFPKSKTLGLCLYDENLYTKDILLAAVHTHPTVSIYNVLRDNPYYFPPDEFLVQEKEKNPDQAYTLKRDALLQS